MQNMPRTYVLKIGKKLLRYIYINEKIPFWVRKFNNVINCPAIDLQISCNFNQYSSYTFKETGKPFLKFVRICKRYRINRIIFKNNKVKRLKLSNVMTYSKAITLL